MVFLLRGGATRLSIYSDIFDTSHANPKDNYIQGNYVLERRAVDYDWQVAPSSAPVWLDEDYRRSMKEMLAPYDQHYFAKMLNHVPLLHPYRSGSGSGKSSIARNIVDFHTNAFPVTSLVSGAIIPPALIIDFQIKGDFEGNISQFMRLRGEGDEINFANKPDFLIRSSDNVRDFREFKKILCITILQMYQSHIENMEYLGPLISDISSSHQINEFVFLERSFKRLISQNVDFILASEKNSKKTPSSFEIYYNIVDCIVDNSNCLENTLDFVLLLNVYSRFGDETKSAYASVEKLVVIDNGIPPFIFVMDNADHLNSNILYGLYQSCLSYSRSKERKIPPSLMKVLLPLRHASVHEVAGAGNNVHAQEFIPPKCIPVIKMQAEKFLFSAKLEEFMQKKDLSYIEAASSIYELLLNLYDTRSNFSKIIDGVSGSNIRIAYTYVTSWLDDDRKRKRLSVDSFEVLQEARGVVAELAIKNYLTNFLRHSFNVFSHANKGAIHPETVVSRLVSALKQECDVGKETKLGFSQHHLKHMIEKTSMKFGDVLRAEAIKQLAQSPLFFSYGDEARRQSAWSYIDAHKSRLVRAFVVEAQNIDDDEMSDLIKSISIIFAESKVIEIDDISTPELDYAEAIYGFLAEGDATRNALKSKNGARYSNCVPLFGSDANVGGGGARRNPNLSPVNLLLNEGETFTPAYLWILELMTSSNIGHVNYNRGVSFEEMQAICNACGVSSSALLTKLVEFVNLNARLIFSVVDDQNVLSGKKVDEIDQHDKYHASIAGASYMQQLMKTPIYLDMSLRQTNFVQNQDFVFFSTYTTVKIELPIAVDLQDPTPKVEVGEQIARSIFIMWQAAFKEREIIGEITTQTAESSGYRLSKIQFPMLHYATICTNRHLKILEGIKKSRDTGDAFNHWFDWIYKYLANLPDFFACSSLDFIAENYRKNALDEWKKYIS